MFVFNTPYFLLLGLLMFVFNTPHLCSWDSLCLSLNFQLFFVYFGNTWRDQSSRERLAAKSAGLPVDRFHVQKLRFNPERFHSYTEME